MSERPESNPRIHLDQDISVHIFTVSAAMVGVCLTVIGLMRIIVTIQKVDTLADDLLALNAVVFLISCGLSYWALRTRSSVRLHRLERIADAVFLCGLAGMVGICGFITFAMSSL
jgi:hypothetical protein